MLLVKDIIKELEQYPPDMPLCVPSEHGDRQTYASGVQYDFLEPDSLEPIHEDDIGEDEEQFAYQPKDVIRVVSIW